MKTIKITEQEFYAIIRGLEYTMLDYDEDEEHNRYAKKENAKIEKIIGKLNEQYNK